MVCKQENGEKTNCLSWLMWKKGPPISSSVSNSMLNSISSLRTRPPSLKDDLKEFLDALRGEEEVKNRETQEWVEKYNKEEEEEEKEEEKDIKELVENNQEDHQHNSKPKHISSKTSKLLEFQDRVCRMSCQISLGDVSRMERISTFVDVHFLDASQLEEEKHRLETDKSSVATFGCFPVLPTQSYNKKVDFVAILLKVFPISKLFPTGHFHRVLLSSHQIQKVIHLTPFWGKASTFTSYNLSMEVRDDEAKQLEEEVEKHRVNYSSYEDFQEKKQKEFEEKSRPNTASNALDDLEKSDLGLKLKEKDSGGELMKKWDNQVEMGGKRRDRMMRSSMTSSLMNPYISAFGGVEALSEGLNQHLNKSEPVGPPPLTTIPSEKRQDKIGEMLGSKTGLREDGPITSSSALPDQKLLFDHYLDDQLKFGDIKDLAGRILSITRYEEFDDIVTLTFLGQSPTDEEMSFRDEELMRRKREEEEKKAALMIQKIIRGKIARKRIEKKRRELQEQLELEELRRKEREEEERLEMERKLREEREENERRRIKLEKKEELERKRKEDEILCQLINEMIDTIISREDREVDEIILIERECEVDGTLIRLVVEKKEGGEVNVSATDVDNPSYKSQMIINKEYSDNYRDLDELIDYLIENDKLELFYSRESNFMKLNQKE